MQNEVVLLNQISLIALKMF